MSAVPEIDADVAIVGCGPVGNTLAILLAQLGRTVRRARAVARALPAAPGRALRPRGRPHPPVVRHRRRALRAISEPADIYEWRNGAGTTLLRFGRAGDGPSGWPASSMFNQPALEALLDRRAGELPAIDRAPRRRGHRPRAARRRASSSTAADGTAVAAPVRRRLRRRQQHRAQPRRHRRCTTSASSSTG